MRKVLISFCVLVACVLAPSVRAALITLDATATGSIRQQQTCGRPGCFALEYTSINPLDDLRFQFATSIGSSSVITSVGYLVFDFTDLGQDAQSAFLELDLQYTTDANINVMIGALSAATVMDLVANPVGVQRGAIDLSTSPITIPPLYSQLGGQFLDIATAVQVGALSQVGPFNGRYSVELTNSALTLLNETDGLFGFGLTWTPNTGDQFPSGGDLLSFNTSPRLLLHDASVPVPGTVWLLLPALLLLLRTLVGPTSTRKEAEVNCVAYAQ